MQDIVYKLVPGLQEGKCQSIHLDFCVRSTAFEGLFSPGSWLWTSRSAGRPVGAVSAEPLAWGPGQMGAMCWPVSSIITHTSRFAQEAQGGLSLVPPGGEAGNPVSVKFNCS